MVTTLIAPSLPKHATRWRLPAQTTVLRFPGSEAVTVGVVEKYILSREAPIETHGKHLHALPSGIRVQALCYINLAGRHDGHEESCPLRKPRQKQRYLTHRGRFPYLAAEAQYCEPCLSLAAQELSDVDGVHACAEKGP